MSSGPNADAMSVTLCGIEGPGIHAHGIEGSGIAAQECNNGVVGQMPPPATGLTMTTARAAHTATLLSDGKVLIAGGSGAASFKQLARAELYDPSTGAFTSTGDMITPRARHTATLLANGKVLIAGGVIDTQQGTYLASAEIYDPSTGAFTATGNMIAGAGWSRSILLPDGRVLIAEDSNAEIYNPATGTFALAGGYSSSGVQVDTATLLADGGALVVGCAAQCGVGTADRFDPKGDSFSATGPRQAWYTVSTATLLTNNTVLFVEGNDSGLPDDAEIYDPVSSTFTHIGYTYYVHEYSTATRLPDGTVLIAGGQQPGGNGGATVESYAPATGNFAPAASLTVGRHGHTATLLGDGTVLLAGGYSVWPYPTSSAEIYK